MSGGEWCVDSQVDVVLTLTKTVTVSRMEIIEADSAEAAVEQVKDELSALDVNDVDISGQVSDSDFEIEDVDLSTFKVTGNVSPWSP